MPDRLFLKVEHAKERRRKWKSARYGSASLSPLAKHSTSSPTSFKVTNVNNATTDQTKLLSLALPDDPPIRLILSEPLSSQVTNGGKVRIYKGFQRP
ncbi:hypothetical protein Rt10032_c29g6864 [Rhodotorula toruloides]|uniref:Uncharacterized protein n=1 Tax=Rhodotorula toruloides TaxID=5286 RepID=A0A511KR40_RHOTO|nr:hypothetical protein Rt10032_c29g6864 [Rhodotorula toruloides]